MSESKNRSAGDSSGTGSVATDSDAVRQAFSALSFEQKISTLLQIEFDILGEAVDTVVSAASKAVDDIANYCAPSEPSASSTPGAGGAASTS